MGSGLLNLLQQFKNQGRVNLNSRLVIFFFFLLLSTFFWFLNTLSKDYKTEIVYSVKYKNYPEDKVLLSNLPNEFKLKVNAYGYSLLRYYFSTSLPPIVIDVNSLYESRVRNKFFVLTSQTKDKISKQFKSEIEILEISPDTLYFEFADMINKKVAIKPNIDVSFQKQFKQSANITIEPDSILVSGANSILDTLKYVFTQRQKFIKLNNTISRNILLEKVQDLKFPDNRVNITIPVEKYTENNFLIPLEIINKPDDIKMQLFPNEVRVTFLVSISQFNELKSYHFKAFVDYSDLQNNLSNKLKVKVECNKNDAFLYSVRTSPSLVEYIIEK